MVFANVPETVPAVNTPPLVIEPPFATTDHVGTNETMLPDASLPTATYCCVAPWFSVTGDGVTVIVASGPTVTVTVATPDLPLPVAMTVLVYVPGTVPAVNNPVGLIEPPPPTID